MPIEAELFDGTILEFPDGTESSVIQATAKRLTTERQAKTEAPKVEEPKAPEKPSLLAGTTLPADAGPMGNREISEVGTAPLPILKDLPKFDVSKMETAEERAKREYGYTPEMTPLETAARFGKRAITAGGVGLMTGYLGVDRFALDMLGVDSSKISDTTGQLEKIQRAKGEASNYALKITEGAISSIAQQVPALFGGVATGSAVVPLAMMFGQSFGQTYDEGRREGLDVGDSTGRAAAFGALEVIGEKFGLGNVLDGIKASAKGMPIKDIAAHFAKALVKEIPGEQLTYAGQFAVDKGYGMNPEAGVKEFIQGAIDTLAQTVVQGGIMMGAGSAASKVARQINKNAPEEKDKVPTARELMEQQGFVPPTKEEPQAGGVPLVNAPPAPPEEEKGPGVLQNIKDKLSEGLSADVEKAKGLWSKITGKTPEATNEFETLVADYEKQGMNRDSAVMLATQDFKETGRGDQLITGAREPSLQAPNIKDVSQGSAAGATGTESGQLGGTSGVTGSTGTGTEAQRGALEVPQNLIDLQAKSVAADEANKVSSTPANKRNATMAARRLNEAKAAQLGLTYEDYLKESDPEAIRALDDAVNTAYNQRQEAPLDTTEAPIVKVGKPKGRPKAELTPEQIAAKAETRKQSQAAGRDAIRTADRAEKTLAEEFDASAYDDLDTAKIALDEFNEKRRQALEDAYSLSIDKTQRLNTAGKKAKALLEKANPQERELAKNRHETRQKINAPSRAEITEFTNGEDNPVFEKFTNAKAALNWIAKNGNDFEQALAKRLAPFLNGVKIVIVDSHTELPSKSLQNKMQGAAGLYVSGRNTIYLMRDGGINNTVVLHETLHGATVNRINAYLQARLEGREVDAKLRVAVVELQETMDDAKQLYDTLKAQGMLTREMEAIPYIAFEDIKEFIAYGLSLPAMQDFLMLAPGEYFGEKQGVITGLFSRFVQSLRKMFNMDENHMSAFQDLIIVTDKLLATNPTQMPDTGEALAAKQRKKKEKADKVLEKIQKGEFADDVGGLLGELIRIRSWSDAKDVFKASWKTIDSKTIQGLMPTLTSMQIIDWVGDKIPHLNNVARAAEKMSVMRSKMLARVSDLSEPWVQFASKYIAGGKTLSTLMHYTTLTEVDPTLHKTLADALKNDTQLIDLRQKYAAAPVKSKPAAKGQITKRERKITQAYGLWNKLGQFGKVDSATGLSQGQQIYSNVKQYYKNTFNLHRAILDERIANANVPGDINDASTPKGKLMAAIRTTYEASKTIGVYFPLMRYGQYWARVGNGQSREFYMFESEFQRNNFIAKRVKQLRKINPNATEAQLRTDDDLDSGNDLAKLRKASTESSEMLKKIFEIIDTTGVQDKDVLKDSVYQMYLLTMPEQSFRGQFIHRKGTAGFSGDALRNFVRSGYTSSGQLSTLKYGPEIFNEMDAADDALEGNPDKERLSNFTRELRRRVVDEVNPTIEDEIGQRFANGVGQAAFLWFLTSAKSAIINMSAIPIFGMPVLASRYGNINAAKVLGSYGNIFNHTTLVKRDADGSLSYTPLSVGFSKHVRENPILEAAFSEAAERGVTEITRTYDLISMAKTPSTKFTGRTSRFVRGSINMAGAMFHHSERINREIMYMSSFELAYAKALKDGLAGGINGAAFNRAVDESVKNTYDSMFNYTKFNRPRIMRHWTTKIALQFKLFPQQVTGYFVRNYMTMYHASIATIKNIDNKQERDAALADLNEGATQFFGSLIMTGMFAGIVGMPLYSVTIGVIQGIMAALRDEDEPVPFEERDLDYWFRYVFLPKHFGDDFARIIQKGPISAISGLDVASSTSLDNLWFRDTQDDKSLLTDVRNQIVGALGPSAGLVENFVKAYEDWKNGHVSQAIEKAMPALFKGMVTQQRWGEEGVTAKTTKAEIMSKEEISVATRFWKALGFNPTELSIQQDKNFKVIEQFRKTEQEYGEIMSHIKTDSMNGNFNRLDKDIEKFVKFAIQNPDMDVDPDSIFTAIENAEIARAEAINGVVVSNEKLRARAHYLLDALEKKTPR